MLAVALIIVPSASLPGFDVFYNVEIADIMRHGNWVVEKFPWTTCSIWTNSYFDKEWLFHLYIIPFISFFGKIQGIKLMTASSGFFIALAWGVLLKTAGVKKHIFSALIFILFSTGYVFLARIVLCRSILFSLFFLPLVLSCVILRIRILLALTVFLYTLSYVGAWQAIPLILIFDFMTFNFKRDFFKKSLKSLMLPWGILGLCAGFAFSPYFPDNINGVFLQTIMVLKAKWLGSGGVNLMQASELEPIQASRLLWHVPLFILIIHAVVNALKMPEFRKEIRSTTGVFFIFTIIYFFMTIFSQRFIEYLAPLSGVFLFLFYGNYGKILLHNMKLNKFGEFILHRRMSILLFLLFFSGIISINLLFKNFYRSRIYYQSSANWLKDNLKDDEIIFTAGWNDSSVLFFHAPQFRYLVMLEPYFMYAYSPRKFFIWQKISLGKIENPSALIKNEFASSVVFIPHNMQALKHKLLRDPYAELQFESKETGESIFILSVPDEEILKLRDLEKLLQSRNHNDRT